MRLGGMVEVRCSVDEGRGRTDPTPLNNLAGSLKMCEYPSAHQQLKRRYYRVETRTRDTSVLCVIFFFSHWYLEGVGERIGSCDEL